MSSRDDERALWRVGDVECVMVSCCAGAELQIRSVQLQPDVEIILRELYPMKSDLYERARELRAEYVAKTDGSSRRLEENEEHKAL